MSLFYFRPWAGAEQRGPGSVNLFLTPENPLFYTRWGYTALLGITMLAGIVLNIIYLLGYWICPRAMLEVPHVAIVSLAIRDLLVCLIVIPASMDWLVAGLTSWPGGEMWCKTAVFFDYYLATLHPLFIIMLCIILYTRKLPPKQDLVMPPAPVMHSRMSARSGYTQRTGSQRPPSVAGSVQSASRHDGTFRKGFSKREGSVNGSTAGSVSGSVSRGPAPYHSNTPQRKISHNSSINSGRHNMRGAQAAPARTSSPLSQVHEDKYAESVDGELWEMASMEYPGRNDLDLEFDDEEDYVPDEPRLREWLKWVVMTMWLLGLGIGAVALEQAQYSDQRPPGCYLAPDKALLAKGRHNYFIRDPTINLLLSTVTINYIVPGIFFIMCSVLLCTTRWTQDGKLNRFFKMCIGLCVMFLASRSSVDILQFRDIIHTSQGISITNKRPDQLENEVLLFWAAIIPVVGNPIIYLFCVTEYRQNIINMWRVCTQGGEKDTYDEDNFLHIPPQEDQMSDLGKAETRESDVL